MKYAGEYINCRKKMKLSCIEEIGGYKKFHWPFTLLFSLSPRIFSQEFTQFTIHFTCTQKLLKNIHYFKGKLGKFCTENILNQVTQFCDTENCMQVASTPLTPPAVAKPVARAFCLCRFLCENFRDFPGEKCLKSLLNLWKWVEK